MRRPTRQINMLEQQVLVRERAMYLGHALSMFGNSNGTEADFIITSARCMRCYETAQADPQHLRSTSGMLGRATEIRCKVV